MNLSTAVQPQGNTLIADICARAAITADDVIALRRELFADGVISRSEAQTMFDLERSCPQRDETWSRFFVEALTDHLVWRAEPRGFISEDNAVFLIENIMHDNVIDGPTEMELLVNVVHWAKASPERLKIFVLKAVRDSVKQGGTDVYGKQRQARRIDPVDIEILRKVIYAVSSDGGITITRPEAEMLFELHDITQNADNDPAWCDLFVKGIANHLMFPTAAPSPRTVEDAKRQEKWLNERGGVRGMLSGIARAFGAGRISASESWSELDPTGIRKLRENEMREDAREREANMREAIDANEARWLVGRIGATNPVHPYVVALLRFIKDNSPHIDDLLITMFARAGL